MRLRLQFSLGYLDLFTNHLILIIMLMFSHCVTPDYLHYRDEGEVTTVTANTRLSPQCWCCSFAGLRVTQGTGTSSRAQTLGKLMAREKYGWRLRLHSEPRHSMISDHNSSSAPVTPRNVSPGNLEQGVCRQLAKHLVTSD